MTTLDQLNTILAALEAVKDDADKFDKGNGTAGTRVRKAAMEAKKTLDDLRRDIQETKKARKGS